MAEPIPIPQEFPFFQQLHAELSEGLRLYWSTAGIILKGSGIELLETEPGYFSLEKNLFSTLFLYSFKRGGIPSARRIIYVAVNQCLRGIVTGCDNLLDEEYKKTLVTDLPEGGTRFRSVVDIMVSDRVLFEILLGLGQEKKITPQQVLSVSRASLGCLAQSGAQEASEEQGVVRLLPPEDLLRSVHHYKTGLLFQSPWAAPEILEPARDEQWAHLKKALYQIGMGCQILDDMVDLEKDLHDRRHNYMASLIFFGADGQERLDLEKWIQADNVLVNSQNLALTFPKAMRQAARKAQSYLLQGMDRLFADEDQPAGSFFLQNIIRRIGAETLLRDSDKEPI